VLYISYVGGIKMSLFNQSDYISPSKKNNVVSPRRASHGGIATSKRARLPTQYRTKKHNCAHCTRTDAKQYSISEKETRWLCVECITKNANRDAKEKPNFVKASLLGREK